MEGTMKAKAVIEVAAVLHGLPEAIACALPGP